jgi:hypothetical protein
MGLCMDSADGILQFLVPIKLTSDASRGHSHPRASSTQPVASSRSDALQHCKVEVPFQESVRFTSVVRCWANFRYFKLRLYRPNLPSISWDVGKGGRR